MLQEIRNSMKKKDYGLWHLIRGILKIILPFKIYLFLTFVCIIVQLTYTLVLPLGMQLIIDKGIKNNDLNLILYVISELGIIYLIFTIAYLFDSYIMSILTARSLDNLRSRMINQVYFLPISYYQQHKSTSILARFSNDIATIENVFIRAISDSIYYTASIICCTFFLFFVQWRLALVVIFLSPLLIIIPKKFSQKATGYSYTYKTSQENLLNDIQEFIRGQSIIRLFGLRNCMMDQYSQTNQTVYNNGIKSNYLNSLVGVTTIIGTGFLLLIIVALGSVLTVKAYMSVGTFIAFSAYLHNITGATQGLSGIIPILYQSIGSMQRIDEFLENATCQAMYSDQIAVQPFENEICLRDVFFSYDGKKTQIKNININIPKGSLTAFVGTSGAGKSTISKLIMGLLLPGQGKILIDKINSAESMELFRTQIGAVLQDTFLFNTSIKENIRYGRLDASDKEIQDAARAAEIHDWIMTLPNTYDMQVGETGENLSGGQRQRIAIARALVRKPKILILDEAFSALDPATEYSINETIKKLAKSMTIISITHNLASVYDFTHIFVMNDGIILEQGDHQQLLSQKGFYYELWQKQTGLYFNKDSLDVEISTDRLAKIPLLVAMNQKDLESIKDHLITETFEQGKDILCQGDVGKRFYIIAKGVVEIERKDSDNNVHHLGVMEPGDYFGEISLFRNCPITANVRARSRTICLVLSREHFQGFLDKYPELEKHMKDMAEQKINSREIRRLSL